MSDAEGKGGGDIASMETETGYVEEMHKIALVTMGCDHQAILWLSEGLGMFWGELKWTYKIMQDKQIQRVTNASVQLSDDNAFQQSDVQMWMFSCK